MRILSQDKLELVNFKNCDSLTLEGKVVIANLLDGYKILGEYESEERVKEVLTDLFHCQYEGFAMPEV